MPVLVSLWMSEPRGQRAIDRDRLEPGGHGAAERDDPVQERLAFADRKFPDGERIRDMQRVEVGHTTHLANIPGILHEAGERTGVFLR